MTTLPSPEWATAKQLSKLEPAFTEPSIRWLIFNSQRNGLDPHLQRIGRKRLVNIAGFRAWIKNQG